MRLDWREAFCEAEGPAWCADGSHASPVALSGLRELKTFLDRTHIATCLLRPYQNLRNKYPLVDYRELLPSFDCDTFEFKELPGFTLVALGRPLNYFQEIFQFDILHPLVNDPGGPQGEACPVEQTVVEQNMLTMRGRIPKRYQEEFMAAHHGTDITAMERYPAMMPFLLELERAHVLSQDTQGNFHLSGIYGSLPSDLDTEIKRFGLRIGKFAIGDNAAYERQRLFVYQFLMELYGFPIVSERRTSSALFARRLHKMGEDYIVRVLGQSDRTITTLWSAPGHRNYPRVEKIALVRVEKEQKDVIEYLKKGGFFVDQRERIIILRIVYKQHKYNPNNVRQDRALTVERQEVIHPVTAEVCSHLNIIRDTQNMFLRLNDIVRGEYVGRTIYKRNEVVENTDTHEKRLKFLFSWLSKHQRRIIGYSDEFFGNVVKVLDNYLLNPENYEIFQGQNDLYQEVWTKYSYIQQARKVKALEDLHDRMIKGKRITYLEQLRLATDLLHDLKFEIVNYFDELVRQSIGIGESMLADSYLKRSYIERHEDDLSEYGREIRKLYRRLVSLMDEFKAIRKLRADLPEAGLAL